MEKKYVRDSKKSNNFKFSRQKRKKTFDGAAKKAPKTWSAKKLARFVNEEKTFCNVIALTKRRPVISSPGNKFLFEMFVFPPKKGREFDLQSQ